MRKSRINPRTTDSDTLKIIFRSKETRRYYLQLLSAFSEQLETVLGNIEQIESQVRPKQALQKIEIDLTKIVAGYIAQDRFRDLANHTAFFMFAGNVGGDVALTKMGIGASFNLRNQELINQLRRAEDFLINSVEPTTIKWISENLANAFDKGLSTTEIVSKLRDDWGDISQSRAQLIVATEASNAAVIVERETYIRNGITKAIWTTTGDNRVTPECTANHEYAITQGGVPFGNAYPYGPNNIQPPRFPGCRCWLEPVLDVEPTGNFIG